MLHGADQGNQSRFATFFVTVVTALIDRNRSRGWHSYVAVSTPLTPNL